MSDGRIVDPGTAAHDMIAEEVDHDTLAAQVWTAMERATAVTRKGNYAEVNIPHLLRSMRETHGSMRAIYTAAEKIEKKKKEPTGRWADMLILSRAQFDAVFIGILLAHDPAQWGPRYYKAGWASDAQRHFYVMRRFKDTPGGRAIRNRNIYCLKERGRSCQVTAKEWIATLADIRGTPLRFGATEQDRIKPFPTPGQIVARGLLQGGPFEQLGATLWVHWRFLCDPAHAGMSTIVLRHGLRDEQLGRVGETRRTDMIYQQIVGQSLVPSLVTILTLTTVLATLHRDNPDLLAAVTKAWDLLAKGTLEGGIVWDKWARQALGVLSV